MQLDLYIEKLSSNIKIEYHFLPKDPSVGYMEDYLDEWFVIEVNKCWKDKKLLDRVEKMIRNDKEMCDFVYEQIFGNFKFIKSNEDF